MAGQARVTVPLHRPKLKEKMFFLISGAIVSVPLTLFVSQFSDYLFLSMPLLYARIFSIAIAAPFIEEFAKAYPLLYRHGETERSIFILGFLVGMGFGIVEFVEYVAIFQAPVILRLPGIFFHAASTSTVAFGVGKKRAVTFYLIAVALHVSNNTLAVLGLPWYLGGTAVVGSTYLLSWFLYQKTLERMIPL